MAGFANNAIDELQDAVFETFTTFCSFGAGQRGDSLMDSVSNIVTGGGASCGVKVEGGTGRTGEGGFTSFLSSSCATTLTLNAHRRIRTRRRTS